ncbi:polysaccharide export protein [Desulfosarcina sp. OttesenSCG-928-A07]|nr:polysaccharide export protein [Desulfosarcina sp. OttesenSCG-928-G17]MDL2330191.1 polysaccharide export protein [Desulfosarcina sp. OttesenSCG-928-A07]
MVSYKIFLPLLCLCLSLCLSACGTYPNWIPASGPSREQILDAQGSQDADGMPGILLLEVDDGLARKLADSKKLDQFDQVFPNGNTNNYLVGPGDVLEVSLWEAPPAMLFGAMQFDANTGVTTTGAVTFPSQMVGADGTISMPFAGRVQVRTRTTAAIEREIARLLEGKANEPQVLVRVIKNNTANVTVVGDVNTSASVPLTPRGERLLDALAASGGVKKEVNRTAIQLSRQGVTATMPLESVIRDPKQNVPLKPGDVVTALFQPQSFSVLGATGQNAEIPFETQGISLAQALARSGGLVDDQADARGVFIFRFEEAYLVSPATTITIPKEKAVSPERTTVASATTVPVVYQVNLRDPASFFVTQNFPIQNHDIIYVANSPSAEFEKFLRLISMPAVTIRTLQQF